LTNSGQIIGATYHGISLFGVLTGGLQNTGTVFGTAATGVYLANGATLVGNLNNAGLIGSSSTSVGALSLSNGLIQGGVNNTTGGTISGITSALSLWATQITNGITNAGLITATGSALFDQHASVITGNLANLGGTISGEQWAINLLGTSISGVLNNTGLIQGTSLGGINIVAGANLQNGLSNRHDCWSYRYQCRCQCHHQRPC
jgi:hypothetical protein